MKMIFSLVMILSISCSGLALADSTRVFQSCEDAGGKVSEKDKINRLSKSKYFCKVSECKIKDEMLVSDNRLKNCISKDEYNSLQKRAVSAAVARGVSSVDVLQGVSTSQGSNEGSVTRVTRTNTTQSLIDRCAEAIEKLGEDRGGKICDRYMLHEQQFGEQDINEPSTQQGVTGGNGDILVDTEYGPATFTQADGQCFELAKLYAGKKKKFLKKKWNKGIDAYRACERGKIKAVVLDLDYESCVDRRRVSDRSVSESRIERDCFSEVEGRGNCTYGNSEGSCFGKESEAEIMAKVISGVDCPTCDIKYKKGKLTVKQQKNPIAEKAKYEAKAEKSKAFWGAFGKIGSVALQGFAGYKIAERVGKDQVNSINACATANQGVLDSHADQLAHSTANNLAPTYLTSSDYLGMACNGGSNQNFAGLNGGGILGGAIGGLFGGPLGAGVGYNYGSNFQVPNFQFGITQGQPSNTGFNSPGFTGGQYHYGGSQLGNQYANNGYGGGSQSGGFFGGNTNGSFGGTYSGPTYGGGYSAGSGTGGGFSGMSGYAF